jgi:DNA repair protein RadA/Sms
MASTKKAINKKAAAQGIGKKGEVKECVGCGEPIAIDVSQCPWCKAWNFEKRLDNNNDMTRLLSEVSPRPLVRIASGPWDPCFGISKREGVEIARGIVNTSVTVLGGEPGAGKSTIGLHIADAIAKVENANHVIGTPIKEVLIIAAEESDEEIRDRAVRVGVENFDKIRVYPMGADTDLAGVIRLRRPCAILLDSMQGLSGELPEQVNLCKGLKALSVELKAPTIIISQVNKEGGLAGLMGLQHAVDTIITLFSTGDSFELEDLGHVEPRVMTTRKNRFGQANFSIPLLMTEKGVIEAPDEDEEEPEPEPEPIPATKRARRKKSDDS